MDDAEGAPQGRSALRQLHSSREALNNSLHELQGEGKVELQAEGKDFTAGGGGGFTAGGWERWFCTCTGVMSLWASIWLSTRNPAPAPAV